MSAAVEEVYRTVGGIEFGILSPNDIRRMSVVEVRVPDTYDEDGVPIRSGLMDGRLGTLEPGQRCETCGNVTAMCTGHFGHIELAAPVIHVCFTKIIHDLLSATCRNCSRLRLSESRIKQLQEEVASLREQGIVPKGFYTGILQEAKKEMRCPHCGAPSYKIKFTKPTIFHEILPEGAQRLMPSTIRDRLERIPNDELELLGIDPRSVKPEWMILQVLPVPPVCVRPSITLESGIRSEDDLTHKLVDIIRINQRLRENMEAGAPPLIIQDLYELLQYHITTYFDNEASGIPPARHRSGRALRTLSQRLRGKEGRFRSNLSGKRVDFSARTVISPDPNLDLNEVGVPIEIAKRLTVPVRVTEQNREEVAQFVKNGPDVYPGALYVIRPDGKRVRLEFVTDRGRLAESLQPGYIVERHLQDGDVVIFNRQPSLHKMSIMAHYVKVLPYKTFRLHLCVCPPYNADFDGDEMNLHVPRSEEARTEAKLLMQVQSQILSPRYGGPIIGAIRDFITATYLLTYKSTLLTKEEFFRLLGAMDYNGSIPEPAVKKPEPRWTGKQVFSLLLPEDFSHVQRANICHACAECLKEKCPWDAYVLIRNGQLISGVIDKASIGAEKAESVYHRLVKEYGIAVGKEFLQKLCKVVNEYISMRGFDYSIGELDLPEEVQCAIAETIEEAKARVRELIKKYREGKLERLPGQSLEESLEIRIMNELARARDAAGEIVDNYFGLDNSGVVMTRTGARGSSLNIGQMTACIGQQSIRGKRITRGYRDRALPHFRVRDPSPEARGFIYSCYRDGLNPVEFFFHAMAGREGLVDTAVRTQQSGYMQRRLINALEHLRVEYDGTVRDPLGNIVQFKYGEDGADPAKSDHGRAVNIERLLEQAELEEVGEEQPASREFIEKCIEGARSKLTPLLCEQLKMALTEARASEGAVKFVVERAVKEYKAAQVEPGECVGVVAAQSIGEPGTQMTLRTFHYAGVREQNVTLGLPRIIEIVDARREPSTPVMAVYLERGYRESRERAEEVAREILYTTVKDVAKVWIDLEEGRVAIQPSEGLMRRRGVSLEELRRAVSLREAEIAEEDGIVYVRPTRPEANLQKICDRIAHAYVKGVSGIRRVLVTEEEREWVIRTDGSNLAEALKVPGVDQSRTTTNNIHEVAETLGIEAARNAIIREIMSVLEEQGLDVDIRHVMLVADMMTMTGIVRQIGRHGASGEKASVLARAAFELTVPNIVEAAVMGEVDKLQGVTENVIVGQTIPIGTSFFDLYMKLSKE